MKHAPLTPPPSASDSAQASIMVPLWKLPLPQLDSPPADHLPIYLPGSLVRKLRALAHAAQIRADDFVAMVIGETVSDAARSTPETLEGAAEIIFNSYVFPDDVRPQIKRALAAAAVAKEGGDH